MRPLPRSAGSWTRFVRAVKAAVFALCVMPRSRSPPKDVKAARSAADELSEFAAGRDAPWLEAMSAHATGAVLLAEGDARAALATLRQAWKSWQEVEAPYEGARARALMGQACRRLGDEDGAPTGIGRVPAWIFQQLGAAPDLARVEALLRPARRSDPAV